MTIGAESGVWTVLHGLRFDPWSGRWSESTAIDADGIRTQQLGRAWQLAEDLAEHNPFYRQRLSIPDTRDAISFASLPLTRKEDVVADCAVHPPFGARTTVVPSDVRMIVQTSGTSGLGTEVYALDQPDLEEIVRTEAVGFLWAGITPGTTVILTFPVGLSAAALWYSAALRAIGANLMSVGAYPTDRKVQLLHQFSARVIIGTPTYLQRLAVACEDLGLDPAKSSVDTLIVAGQSFSESWAASIEERWGATLFEQYGCTERAIAWTCPGGVLDAGRLRVLHFPPEAGYYEVIDRDTGTHVGHGEQGELVATPFGAHSSPLIRYATGDRVRWMAPGSCTCGRPLAGIAAGEIERFDDMMKIKGVNVWPASFDRAISSVSAVTDYRGRATTTPRGEERIEIRAEGVGDPSSLAASIAEAVQRITGLSAVITIEPTGTLAREVPEGFVKVKRFNDERKIQ